MGRMVPPGSIPAPVVDLCREIRGLGEQAWVVGGSLRDVLMGRQPSDWDLATSATPEQLQRGFRRVIPTGIEHGTVTILWKGVPYEVTTLRGEGAYTDQRRPDSVHFVRDIDTDLSRRDFTVNAIAYDPLEDRLADPFGGLADLERRLLRTVGDAAARFGEDGLRVLRAARFVATLEFELDPASEAAIPGALAAFQRVSAERVRDEWLKTMRARQPSRSFEVMRRTGILAISCPELMEQVGCAQNRYHAYDVWRHSLECMDACPHADEVHRIAGLLHDLGKPATRELSDKTGDYTFYNHEQVGARLADRWLRRYRFSNQERERVVHLVRHHLVCYSSEWSDAAVRRFIKRVGPDHVADLLQLARADALGKGRPVDEELAALEELRARITTLSSAGAAFGIRELAISGHDLIETLHMPQSRRIGETLEALLERVLEDPALNQRDRLLTLAAELQPTLGDAKGKR